MVKLLRFGRRGAPDPAAEQADAAELARRMERVTAPSRRSVIGRLGAVLRRRAVDEQLWEELEQLLIEADLGVPTVTLLLERLRAAGASDAEALRARLREELVALLEAADQPPPQGTPRAPPPARSGAPRWRRPRRRRMWCWWWASTAPARPPRSPSWPTPTAPRARP